MPTYAIRRVEGQKTTVEAEGRNGICMCVNATIYPPFSNCVKLYR
jgi:hypothetical protein